MNQIFTPVTLGGVTLSNRLVMAPMTRSRADDAGVPTENVATYYVQRSTAGLIVSEGVFPSAMGKGYIRSPGIIDDAQFAAWKHVVAGVHAVGGRIFMQVMHCGRISHPSLLPAGATPVAPSAIKPAGQAWTPEGQQDFVTPRALSTTDVKDVIEEFRFAARRAIDAGFDGVELHGASGYLPEQFLASGSNERSDEYGGSVDGRTQFIVEVLDAMVAEVGAGRVGLKISPEMNFNDILDANPQETYARLVERIAPLGLAYLHVGIFGQDLTAYHALLKPLFNGPYLIGGGLTHASAEALIAGGKADAVVFGRDFIANPDLPARFRVDAPLAQADPSTFYSPGAKGYVDYDALGITTAP